MNKYKAHAVFAAIAMLVLGGIAFQMTRADAVASAPIPTAATISPLDLMQHTHGLPTQTVADPV